MAKFHSQIRPLEGVKVVELDGLAPAPFCGLILADFGATITLVDKPTQKSSPMDWSVEQRLTRGKQRIEVDLKTEEGRSLVRELCMDSDVLLDPYRPGVLERLGLNPVNLIKENKKLIVARITGYGQTGDLSRTPSHDINYVAMSGLLPTINGPLKERKSYWPPSNLLADFAGGAMSGAFAIVSALYRRNLNGGEGFIIDVSMTEGVAYLGSYLTMYKDVDYLFGHQNAIFSGKCPVYRTYETSDGKHIAVAALEAKFRSQFFGALGMEDRPKDLLNEPQKVINELQTAFKTKTRDEWTKIFKEVEACVTPVLDMQEVGEIRHFKERDSFRKEGQKWIPQPAPRIYSAQQFEAIINEYLSKI